MAPEIMSQYPDSLSTIYISRKETCDIHWFVNQYIESRDLRARPHARDEVFDALRDYPGMAPVRLYELNAWLDRNFRPKVFSRPAARLLKLIISNDHIPQRR
ncbi:hypothetical protein [Pseudomonas sp. GM25]|uniref:hypothetical protein n=1 Tax=Pseudomonas sp. GM25 TaxID=1144327 RepID=UPI00026FF416|nr:hypothetical protein [Pseudomonas sp. GM25]EJM27509.1 hypothetical protein PMI24_03131 [Pseudomonas sp. GM25]